MDAEKYVTKMSSCSFKVSFVHVITLVSIVN